MIEVSQVLTIAGSDSGGGAGIQADLKTFQERGVFGTSVITAITAQNTLGVFGIHDVPQEMIQQQLDVVFADFKIKAAKTGMLANSEVIQLVAKEIRQHSLALVVDPVMIAKGGAALLQASAIGALKEYLIPLAEVVTPNIPEAEEILGEKIQGQEDYERAARALQHLGGKNIVIKGGHDAGKTAADFVLYEDQSSEWLTAPRIDTNRTHGTGCTFSACITAELGKGRSPKEAIHTAKSFIQAAIEETIHVGSGHGPTNHWAYGRRERENNARY